MLSFLRPPGNSRRFYAKVAAIIDAKNGKLNSALGNLFVAIEKLKATQLTLFISHDFPQDEAESATIDDCIPKAPHLTTAFSIVQRKNGLEGVARVVLEQLKKETYSHVLAVHDTFGKSLLPRIAARLSAPYVPDLVNFSSSSDSEMIATRSIYAGNALIDLKVKSASNPETSTAAGRPICFTIRPTAFSLPAKNDSTSKPLGQVEGLTEIPSGPFSKYIKSSQGPSLRPDLSSAKVIVSGGRALKSAENFNRLIEPLADVLGAAVGASRAAVDAGYVANDLQIGQTGKIVAPQLYFAIGISGAIQHVAGMKDSKVIVAINKDPECPIFQIADYGLVGDIFTILPELTDKLKTALNK